MSLGSVEAIKAIVAAGLGCGILPAMAVREEKRMEFVVRPLTPRLHRTLGVVIRRDKSLTKGLKATYDALLQLGRR
jgi:DNA-binding transcriptional LysR family regulator